MSYENWNIFDALAGSKAGLSDWQMEKELIPADDEDDLLYCEDMISFYKDRIASTKAPANYVLDELKGFILDNEKFIGGEEVIAVDDLYNNFIIPLAKKIEEA